jgi:hypothetical protein
MSSIFICWGVFGNGLIEVLFQEHPVQMPVVARRACEAALKKKCTPETVVPLGSCELAYQGREGKNVNTLLEELFLVPLLKALICKMHCPLLHEGEDDQQNEQSQFAAGAFYGE